MIVMLETIQDVFSLFASTCTASRRAPATLCRSQPLCQQLHGVLTRCPMASTRPPMPTLRRRKRRRTRCAKEARDTLAAVNFVYVIAGTDFFEGFSVYSSPFFSLFSTVFLHLFVSDLVWEWFMCGRAKCASSVSLSNGSVHLESCSHSAASCSRS